MNQKLFEKYSPDNLPVMNSVADLKAFVNAQQEAKNYFMARGCENDVVNYYHEAVKKWHNIIDKAADIYNQRENISVMPFVIKELYQTGERIIAIFPPYDISVELVDNIFDDTAISLKLTLQKTFAVSDYKERIEKELMGYTINSLTYSNHRVELVFTKTNFGWKKMSEVERVKETLTAEPMVLPETLERAFSILEKEEKKAKIQQLTKTQTPQGKERLDCALKYAEELAKTIDGSVRVCDFELVADLNSDIVIRTNKVNFNKQALLKLHKLFKLSSSFSLYYILDGYFELGFKIPNVYRNEKEQK